MPGFNHIGQKGCPNIVPGLRALPVWQHAGAKSESESATGPAACTDFPWLEEVEAHFERVRGEFLAQQGHQTDGTGIKFQVGREFWDCQFVSFISFHLISVSCSPIEPLPVANLKPRRPSQIQLPLPLPPAQPTPSAS